MEKYQGVAITDGVNRKNHILPLNAIIKAYRDTFLLSNVSVKSYAWLISFFMQHSK